MLNKIQVRIWTAYMAWDGTKLNNICSTCCQLKEFYCVESLSLPRVTPSGIMERSLQLNISLSCSACRAFHTCMCAWLYEKYDAQADTHTHTQRHTHSATFKYSEWTKSSCVHCTIPTIHMPRSAYLILVKYFTSSTAAWTKSFCSEILFLLLKIADSHIMTGNSDWSLGSEWFAVVTVEVHWSNQSRNHNQKPETPNIWQIVTTLKTT